MENQTPITLLVGREAVEIKDGPKNAGSKAGTLDDLRIIPLDDTDQLKEIFTRYGHSVWECEGRRKTANVVALHAIAIDIDSKHMTPNMIRAAYGQWQYVAYPTATATEDCLKWHVLLPLPEPITDTGRFQAVCDWLKARFPEADAEVFKVSQPLVPCAKFYRKNGSKVESWAHNHFDELFHTNHGEPFTIPDSLRPPREKSNKSANHYPITDEMLEAVDILLEMDVHTDSTSRNVEAYRRACECRKIGWSEDIALKRMLEWNRQHVEPPLPEEESEGNDNAIVYTVQRAFAGNTLPNDYSPDGWPTLKEARKEAARRIKARQLEQDHPSPLPDVLLTTQQAIVESVKPTHQFGQLKTFTLADLAKIEELMEEPEELLQSLCWREHHTILCGESGVGKSTVIRSLCADAAAKDFRTLWLTNEAEPQALIWWRRVGGHEPEVAANIEVVDPRYLILDIDYREKRWDAYEELIRRVRPDVIVIDSLYSMLDFLDGGYPDDNETGVWMRKIRSLSILATQVKAGLLTLHHTNKSGVFTGSMGIKNACDDMFLMTRSPRDNNKRIFKNDKTRWGRTRFEMLCDITGIGAELRYLYRVVTDDETPGSLTPMEKQVINLLRENDDGMMHRDFVNAGMKGATVTKTLRSLKANGLVKKNGSKWELTAESEYAYPRAKNTSAMKRIDRAKKGDNDDK
jgi:hypothetical protein